MANKAATPNETGEVSIPEVTASAEVSLSLVDFCTRLSETVKRPELIGAFEFSERRADRVTGTDAEYRARFAEFANTPV